VAEEPSGPPAFDAVLIVRRASATRVAGLSLLERAAFTLARAGARRLLCLGDRPAPAMRLPDVAIEWAARADDPVVTAWIAAATARVIGMDAAAVVDRETIAALASDPRATVLTADGAAALWRAPAPLVALVLSQALALADESHIVPKLPQTTAWTAPASGFVIVVHDAAAARAAAAALFARLGRSGDGWFTRLIDRRISRALTRLLLPAAVTPNQVTVASIAVGILAAALFATGSRGAAIAGSLLFLASTIVDGCDGELARLTFRESEFGARLDVIGDNVVHLFLFAGIAAGLYRREHDPRVALAGWLLVAGVFAAMAAVYACIVRREPTPRQRTLFEAFASREFAYLLVVFTVAGKLEWFLWISVAGTYAFVAGLLALRR
jgi:phosphatidylglycerophosphate synthase